MRILLLVAATLLAQPAIACTERMSDRALAAKVEELAKADADTGQQVAKEIRAALDGGLRDYCAGYTLARYLTLRGNFDAARDYMIAALGNATQADLDSTAPWNIIGFTRLREGDYQGALTAFRHQIEHPTFSSQTNVTQMKVLNNAGFSALQVGQYDDAIKSLTAARDLGSRTATRNLAIAESILGTLKSGDIDAPGIFTTVIKSLREPGSVEAAVDEAAAALDGGGNISVFLSKNGFYAITYGAYESYPKAEARQKLAREKGYDDAFVTSVAEWKDVTAEFLAKR